MGIRLPLALNAVDQGFGLEAGAARIARVQFDYTDLSALDRVAKRIIPFWVFASRNIPLQLINQAVRPGPLGSGAKSVGVATSSAVCTLLRRPTRSSDTLARR